MASFPQIWVAAGLIDCGAPLVPDPCSITATSSRLTTYPQAGPSTVFSTEITEFIGSRISQNTYTPTILPSFTITTTDATTTGLGRRSQKIPPEKRHTHDEKVLSPISSIPSSPLSNPIDVSAIALSTHALLSPPLQREIDIVIMTTLIRRSYDFDDCLGVLPSHDLRTNSLAEVCHFVANVQDLFVSLAPTSAAYMPSWLSYLTTSILSFYQTFASMRASELENLGATEWKAQVSNIAVCILAVFRSVWATIKIVQHKGSYATLPFISPLLWVDWITVVSVFWTTSSLFGWIGICLTVCVYGACLWLCVGYGMLGYGRQQYMVLNIPAQCQHLNIQWQTDPRRKVYLALHITLFAFASVAVAIGIGMLARHRRAWIAYNESVGNSRHFRETNINMFKGTIAMVIAGGCLVGIGWACYLNWYDYLVLRQQDCYASFISSRLAYLDTYRFDVSYKVGEFFGLFA